LNFTSNEKTLSGNREAFAARFPELAVLLSLDTTERMRALAARLPPDYELTPSQSGAMTLSVRGTYLHSKYNPIRDAERALSENSAYKRNACVFSGCALGYLPELYARQFPKAQIVLIEPDIFVFLLFLSSRPLEAFFAHENLILIIGTTPREANAFLEKLFIPETALYANPAIMSANKPWFDEFALIMNRNKEKRQINANTLKKFGDLWLTNMCRNLDRLRDLDGINKFSGILSDIPILILAAGPSLDRVLPLLPRYRERCAIIAVDTAVRACVSVGVQPDFIVLVDPQYWNWRHLDGIDCPESILITESAVWPAVFRFKCKEIVLCSSLFPLGKFLETRTEIRGELGAGGSVSTTAWDFARHLGSKTIYMAALDLGFPERKTHFTGSIFEDRTHTVSGRFSPAETAGYLALYGAAPYPVPNYLGSSVLTDKRLILYAWWFESRLAAYPEHRTATITPEGVKIPGFAVANEGEILALPQTRRRIDDIFLAIPRGTSDTQTNRDKTGKFEKALVELHQALSDMGKLAERGIQLCNSYSESKSGNEDRSIIQQLNDIDRKILMNPAKEIAAMVFTQDESHPDTSPIEVSRKIYAEIAKAVEKNKKTLAKFH
jgi:hypothetical protein